MAPHEDSKLNNRRPEFEKIKINTSITKEGRRKSAQNFHPPNYVPPGYQMNSVLSDEREFSSNGKRNSVNFSPVMSPVFNGSNKPNRSKPYHKQSCDSLDDSHNFRFSLHALDSPVKNRWPGYSTRASLVLTQLSDRLQFDMCFNLFSLYGNIEGIWINYQQLCGIVTYQHPDQMKIAFENLNGLPLFGKVLTAKPAYQDSLVEQLAFRGEFKDYSGFRDQRFKIPGSKNFKNLNPPCSTLHLSNLPENIELDSLRELFSPIAEPHKISHFNEFTNMALAGFSSLAGAVAVLTKFHNYNICGR